MFSSQHAGILRAFFLEIALILTASERYITPVISLEARPNFLCHGPFSLGRFSLWIWLVARNLFLHQVHQADRFSSSAGPSQMACSRKPVGFSFKRGMGNIQSFPSQWGTQIRFEPCSLFPLIEISLSRQISRYESYTIYYVLRMIK